MNMLLHERLFISDACFVEVSSKQALLFKDSFKLLNALISGKVGKEGDGYGSVVQLEETPLRDLEEDERKHERSELGHQNDEVHTQVVRKPALRLDPRVDIHVIPIVQVLQFRVVGDKRC